MAKDQNIIRVAKKRENPYVMIDKLFLENNSLSWKAKGLLTYLLSKPDDWQVRLGDLIKQSTDGRDSVRAGLKELITAGYVVRQTLRDENGKFLGTEYLVFERPQETDVDNNERASKSVTTKVSTVDGKSVNGKTVNGKPATTNKRLLLNNELTNKQQHEKEKQVVVDVVDDKFIETIMLAISTIYGRSVAKATVQNLIIASKFDIEILSGILLTMYESKESGTLKNPGRFLRAAGQAAAKNDFWMPSNFDAPFADALNGVVNKLMTENVEKKRYDSVLMG